MKTIKIKVYKNMGGGCREKFDGEIDVAEIVSALGLDMAFALKEDEPKMPFRAEKGKHYWAVRDTANIKRHTDSYGKQDEHRYSMGNYFETREEATEHRDYQTCIGKVRLAILEANDGWVPDWSNGDKSSFYIGISRSQNNKLKVWSDSITDILSMLPYMKSEKIAKQIIEDYEEELKLIFKV